MITAAPLTITAIDQSRTYGPTGARWFWVRGDDGVYNQRAGLNGNGDTVTSVTLTGTSPRPCRRRTPPLAWCDHSVVGVRFGAGQLYDHLWFRGSDDQPGAADDYGERPVEGVRHDDGDAGLVRVIGLYEQRLVNSESIGSVTLAATSAATSNATTVQTLVGALTPSSATAGASPRRTTRSL